MKNWKVESSSGAWTDVQGHLFVDPSNPGLVMFMSDNDERNPDNRVLAAFFRPASVVSADA